MAIIFERIDFFVRSLRRRLSPSLPAELLKDREDDALFFLLLELLSAKLVFCFLFIFVLSRNNINSEYPSQAINNQQQSVNREVRMVVSPRLCSVGPQ